MLDEPLLSLTWRVLRSRLRASPLVAAAGLAFPGLVLGIGLYESYETAAKLFIFLLPHAFLIAGQDMVRSDVESGALENVLFMGGRFRRFLLAKTFVLAAAAGAYAGALFVLFAAWGLAAGRFKAVLVAQFALGLLVGLYYVGLAGVLSHFLRAGSNVVAVLMAQTAALLVLLLTTTARTGLLDYAASGRFPGIGPGLAFGVLVAVVPNLVTSPALFSFGWEVAAGLGLALLVHGRLVGRLELAGGEGIGR